MPRIKRPKMTFYKVLLNDSKKVVSDAKIEFNFENVISRNATFVNSFEKMIENYKQSKFWSQQGVKIDNFSHQLSTIGSKFFATSRYLTRALKKMFQRIAFVQKTFYQVTQNQITLSQRTLNQKTLNLMTYDQVSFMSMTLKSITFNRMIILLVISCTFYRWIFYEFPILYSRYFSCVR